MQIQRLKLQNFRRYKSIELDLSSPLTIIYADNATGKSTLLEALYFITNQTTPFTSEVSDLINYNQEDLSPYFRIEIDVKPIDGDDSDTKILALYQNGKVRQFFIDGHKTTRMKFQENLSSTLFSPEHIDLLMVSPQKRREFLDGLIPHIDRDYSEILLKFKKVHKQRNAYLKKLAKNFYETGRIPDEDKQLKYWTDLFVHLSAGLMVKRADYLAQVQNGDFTIKYEPSLELNDFADLMTQEDIEKAHTLSMNDNHKRDIATGHSNIGAHRDDWNIVAGKDIRRHGSRGEKRMAIGRMIFKTQEIFIKSQDFKPVLLLDDISSELDDKNTDAILKEETLKHQQTIITTIRLDDLPDAIKKSARIIQLSDYI